MDLPHLTSALSPGVHKLITETGINDEGQQGYIHDGCGALTWEAVEVILPELEESADYFQSCVRCLAPLFKQAEDTLSVLTPEEFSVNYQSNLTWISDYQVHVCLDAFKMLKSGDGVQSLLALQLITSTLERSLGDVFVTHSSAPCPSLLKDLLTSNEIKSVFGNVVVQVLRTVIGPPISLNLRNVIWHGFAKPEEIPIRYGWFLLLIIPSLGQILTKTSTTDISHRSPVDFPQVAQYQELLSGVSLDDCGDDLLSVNGVFCGRTPVLQAALEYYRQTQYGFTATLLLPQLEHGLRCTYAVINKCPERIMTAEATTLYTTFDEILDFKLPNNEENCLASFVGEQYMDILHDLLVYPEGPRVRDRLSHGEVNWYTFPKELALGIIMTAALLPNHCQTHKMSNDDTKQIMLTTVHKFRDTYQSMFHPVPIVKQMLKSLMYKVSTMNKKIFYTSDLQLRASPDVALLCGMEDQQLLHNFRSDILHLTDHILLGSFDWIYDFSRDELHDGLFCMITDSRDLVDKLLKRKVNTLYLFQKYESRAHGPEEKPAERVSLLRHIVTECLTVVSQVDHMLTKRQEQFEAKQLRSRQRTNFQRLIISCPFLHHVMQLIGLIVMWQIYSLSPVVSNQCHGHRSILKFLRTMLQFVENLRTYTSCDKNKWKECVELSVTFIQKLQETFT